MVTEDDDEYSKRVKAQRKREKVAAALEKRRRREEGDEEPDDVRSGSNMEPKDLLFPSVGEDGGGGMDKGDGKGLGEGGTEAPPPMPRVISLELFEDVPVNLLTLLLPNAPVKVAAADR